MAWKDKAQALQSWLHETAPARKEAFEQVRVPTSRITCLVWRPEFIVEKSCWPKAQTQLSSFGPKFAYQKPMCLEALNVGFQFLSIIFNSAILCIFWVKFRCLTFKRVKRQQVSCSTFQTGTQSNSTHEGFGKLCGQRDSSVETQRLHEKTVWAAMSRCNWPFQVSREPT